MEIVEFIRSHPVALPQLAKFAAGMMIIFGVAQVAATLAATLVAFDTFDPLHQRLIDHRMLNVVLVLVLTTATLGPVLTERFAPRMLEDSYSRKAENA